MENLKNQFDAQSAVKVLDENGEHMANAYVFPVSGGWAYVDDNDGWSEISKEEAERLVGTLA